jgi:hypothetical protein
MNKVSYLIVGAVALVSAPSFGGEPTYVEGKNIFIETGVDAVDRSPTWYAPMLNKPYAPVFEILATKGTEGRPLLRLHLRRHAAGDDQVPRA